MALHHIYDADGLVARSFWYDDDADRLHTRTHAPPADSLLEHIKERREQFRLPDPKRAMQPVCDIPVPMFEKWLFYNDLTLAEFNSDKSYAARLIAHCRSEWPHLMIKG